MKDEMNNNDIAGITDDDEQSLMLRSIYKGKIEVVSKAPVRTKDDLATIYIPGIIEPCMFIAKDPENARRFTIKSNTVAVVSDGSAVPGIGNIGGLAVLPALEGKAVLFKELSGIDAFPVCLDTQDTDEIVETVKHIAPTFGAINLEGISAPRCFEIERRLKEELDIPVFHDCQHGTAIAVSAAVVNAFRFLDKQLTYVHAVISGAGAAGAAVAKMLYALGIRDIVICDSKGIINATRIPEFGEDKLELLEFTNKEGLTGGLDEAVMGRDLFIGVSKPGVLTEKMVRSMADDPVIFALASPEPEIQPDLARGAGARIIGTGKPGQPNQIDKVLVFPGIFRGILDAHAKEITEAMEFAALHALAGLVPAGELSEDHVLPAVLEGGVAEAVARAVAEAWALRGEG